MTFTIAGGAGTLVKFQYNASDILLTLLQLAFEDLILNFVHICQCNFCSFCKFLDKYVLAGCSPLINQCILLS